MAAKEVAEPAAVHLAQRGDRARQPERPAPLGRPLTPATLLAVQRTAGNRAAQRLVAEHGPGQAVRPGPSVVAQRQQRVQRQEAAVGQGGGAYLKHDVNLPAEDFAKLYGLTAAWPVHLKAAKANMEGYWSAGTSGSVANARGFGQFGAARNAGLRTEMARILTEGSVGSVGVKGTWELTGGKTELSATIAANLIGLVAEGKIIFVRLGWDERTLASNGGWPVGDLMQASIAGKRAHSFSYLDEGGTQHKFVGQLGVTLEFEPNWKMIGRYILTALGDLTPVLLPLGAAAGLAAIVWAGVVNAEHQQQILAVTRAMTRQIIRAGDAYAGRMTDRVPGGGGGAAADKAMARADADLGGVYSRFGINRGQFLGALDLAAHRQMLFIRLSNDYSLAGIGTFAQRMRERVEAWHREHWFVTFLSGRYTADDMNLVEGIIQTELANHGQPTIG